MHRNVIDLVGFAAGILTTIAFIPQVWHSWQTRDLSGVSLRMYGLFTLGVSLWLIYGVAMRSLPITIANAVTLLLAGLVLSLKLRHRNAYEGH
jgi:MtN3 and saliva related transmembrane protein